MGYAKEMPFWPTLFGIYINDLAVDLKGCTNGINIRDLILHALLYADNLALISDSEINLQKILDHRVKGHPTSEFNFTYGNENIQIVSQYKYLCVIMDEHLDFNILTSTLASSANRPLGSIYTKFHKLKGLECFTFTGIWGYKKYDKLTQFKIELSTFIWECRLLFQTLP